MRPKKEQVIKLGIIHPGARAIGLLGAKNKTYEKFSSNFSDNFSNELMYR
jgi:hypothetical protein